MAIPSPVSRKRRPTSTANDEGVAPPPQPEATRPTEPRATSRSVDPRRVTGRLPSELRTRLDGLSPAIQGLSVAEFLDLLYQDEVKAADITVEELFRMRDNGVFPDPFVSGDPRALFTEEMCRRGQFVPVAWHADGISFATCKGDAAQDDLARALDLIVKLPVTLFTVTEDHVDQGIAWLFRKSR